MKCVCCVCMCVSVCVMCMYLSVYVCCVYVCLCMLCVYMCIVSVCVCACAHACVHICVVWYAARMGQNIGHPIMVEDLRVETFCHFQQCLSSEEMKTLNETSWGGTASWTTFHFGMPWDTLAGRCPIPVLKPEWDSFLHQNELIVSQCKAIDCVLLATPTLSFSRLNLEGRWGGRKRTKA